MGSIQRFEELEVWQRARELLADVYRVSSNGPFAKDFGLRDQLRRAAVSVVSNIAEGFERSGNKEFIHFLYLAKGSSGELRAQLYLAADLLYLTPSEFNMLLAKSQSVTSQLSGFIKYLEKATVVRAAKPARRSQSDNLRI